VLNANRSLLKDDELVIISGKLQPDRFTGGVRLKVEQVMDLATARCRFGKFLRVAVNGKAPDIQRIVRDFPPLKTQSEHGELLHGLEVRLAVRRETGGMEVGVDLKLDERSRFFPTDAALSSWIAQADHGKAMIVYE